MWLLIVRSIVLRTIGWAVVVAGDIMIVITDMKVEMKDAGLDCAVAVPIASSMETETARTDRARDQQGGPERRQETSESETKPFHFMNPGRFYRSPVPR